MVLERKFTSLSATVNSKAVVELFFDLVSPFSYVQFELLRRQKCQWNRLALRYTPAFLGGVMRSANNPAPLKVPAKAKHILVDMVRMTDYYKIPYKMYPNFPEYAIKMSSLKAQRFFVAIEPQISKQQYETLIGAFYQNLFSPTKSLDISSVDTIVKIAIDVGVDKAVIDKSLDSIGTDEVKKSLLTNTQRVVDSGGFGLPTTLIHLPNGVEMVFGCDRMHIVGHLLGEEKPPILRE